MLWINRGTTLVLMLAAVLVTGCAQPKVNLQDMKAPERPVELDQLDAWAGTWAFTGEMKCAGADKPMTCTGTETYAWDVDRRVLVSHSDMTMGDGSKMKGLGLFTWDPVAKNYPGWMFDSWGAMATGYATTDDGGKTWKMKSKGRGPDGAATVGETTVKIPDANTMEWTFTEWDSWKLNKRMEGQGVSKRQ